MFSIQFIDQTHSRKMAVECCSICGLPEDCVANALSLTTPKDVCRLSAVASTFRSAAQSDSVWERFLPSDYRDIISRSIDDSDSWLCKFQSRKDLYLHLSDHPILIDDGLKSFKLEKWSGKKCYMLAARDLYIVWGDTSQYWQWIPHPESRFSEVAELLDVCWFEIRGCINTKMLSFSTVYAAYLVFTTKSRMNGFDYHPVEACVGIKGHEMVKRTVCLDPEGEQRRMYQIVPRRRAGSVFNRLWYLQRQQDDVAMEDSTELLRRREDGWMEVELGEYFVKGGEDDLEMSVMEVKGGNWKSGLIVQGIEIRPKKCI